MTLPFDARTSQDLAQFRSAVEKPRVAGDLDLAQVQTKIGGKITRIVDGKPVGLEWTSTGDITTGIEWTEVGLEGNRRRSLVVHDAWDHSVESWGETEGEGFVALVRRKEGRIEGFYLTGQGIVDINSKSPQRGTREQLEKARDTAIGSYGVEPDPINRII